MMSLTHSVSFLFFKRTADVLAPNLVVVFRRLVRLDSSPSVCDTYLTECFEDGAGGSDRTVQIDFSAAFDRVNHQEILFKLCSVGVGGSVLSVLTHFLSN